MGYLIRGSLCHVPHNSTSLRLQITERTRQEASTPSPAPSSPPLRARRLPPALAPAARTRRSPAENIQCTRCASRQVRN